MIAIIDYDVGNLHNLKNALDFQGIPNRIVREPKELEAAQRIMLPGVGAFRPAIERLRRAGMEPAIRRKIAQGVPFLGICLGLQLLLEMSEEGGPNQGLGLIAGRVVRFRTNLKVPQIGWNQVALQRPDPLLEGIPDGSYFYFVHSYHAAIADPADALGLTEYGVVFPAIVRHGNVWGVQFHPEKSQNAGLRLLKNFATMNAA
jgi:glutamine amidotransferase